MQALIDHLARTLDTLDGLPPHERPAFLAATADATGGYVKHPQPGNGWDSQRVEIKALEVYAEGLDMAEALRNWTRAARATASRVAAREARVREAAALIRHPGPVETGELMMACHAVLEHPAHADADTRLRAEALLRCLGPTAA